MDEKELIDRERALGLLASARKAAERGYKGERLKGVLSGLSIAENLIREMEAEDKADEKE